MINRTEYQKLYMRKRRAQQPPCRSKRLVALAEAVRDELASSNTEKGKKLHAMAVEALNGKYG